MSHKKLTAIFLFVPFLLIIAYVFYTTHFSGQPYTTIQLQNNTSINIGDLSLTNNGVKKPLRIEPLMLAPEGNPYRFNLSVGYLRKVGRSSLKRTEYSHNFTIKDPNNQQIFESNKHYQNKNKLGGNTKLVLHTESIGVVNVETPGMYQLSLDINPLETEINSIQLSVRKNIAKINPLILALLIAANVPGFIMLIVYFPKTRKFRS